jgi:hypothetical protein
MVGLHAKEELPEGAHVMRNRNRHHNNNGQQQQQQQPPQPQEWPQQHQHRTSIPPGVPAGGPSWDGESAYVDADADMFDEDY